MISTRSVKDLEDLIMIVLSVVTYHTKTLHSLPLTIKSSAQLLLMPSSQIYCLEMKSKVICYRLQIFNCVALGRLAFEVSSHYCR